MKNLSTQFRTSFGYDIYGAPTPQFKLTVYALLGCYEIKEKIVDRIFRNDIYLVVQFFKDMKDDYEKYEELQA